MNQTIRFAFASLLLAAAACDVELPSEAEPRSASGRTRIFDGRTEFAAIGLEAPDPDHEYVENCTDTFRGVCTIWACVDALDANQQCRPLGSYPNTGGLPADADWTRPSKELPSMYFVDDEATLIDDLFTQAQAEDEECHENSGFEEGCVDIPGAGAIACTLTVCGIKSYYVCCGQTGGDGCQECPNQSLPQD